MEKQFESEIIHQSRHQFLYGRNTPEREKMLKKMIESNPIKMNDDYPMALYLEDYSLYSDTKNEAVEQILLTRMNQEYFNFSLAVQLLEKTLDGNNLSLYPEAVEKFLRSVNRLFINSDAKDIGSLQELLNILKLGCDFYKIHYQATLNAGCFTGFIGDIPISFLDLPAFIRNFKKMLNNNSYVAAVIDVKNPITKIATQTINDYLARRCNGDLSIKVVTEPAGWVSYYDTVGRAVEYIHDYGIVELDDSFKIHIEEVKKRSKRI